MAMIASIYEGKIALETRKDTPFIQGRFRVGKKWKRFSTGTADLDEAKRKAREEFDRYLNAIDKYDFGGMPFDKAAKATIEHLEQTRNSIEWQSSYQDYIYLINRYLIPFFKGKDIAKINQPLLYQWEDWKRKERGKPFAESTIRNHNAALNQVFDFAIRNGWMKEADKPKLHLSGIKPQNRNYFTPTEWDKLIPYAKKWRVRGDKINKKSTIQIRQLLYSYMRLLYYTGIRHGTEAFNLKWSDMYEDKNKELWFHIKGKIKRERRIKVSKDVKIPLKHIKDNNEKYKDLFFEEMYQLDDHVIRLPDGKLPARLNDHFKKLLNDAEIDAKGKSLYSIRHTFAMRMLAEKVNIYDLAKYMGSSVEMIENFYGKHSAEIGLDELGSSDWEKFQGEKAVNIFFGSDED